MNKSILIKVWVVFFIFIALIIITSPVVFAAPGRLYDQGTATIGDNELLDGESTTITFNHRTINNPNDYTINLEKSDKTIIGESCDSNEIRVLGVTFGGIMDGLCSYDSGSATYTCTNLAGGENPVGDAIWTVEGCSTTGEITYVQDGSNTGSVDAVITTVAAVDIDSPTFSLATNDSTSYRYQDSTFNITITDDNNVDGYWFSWNITGTWVNDTWTDITDATPYAVSVSKNITLPPYSTISWRFYANDTTGNLNASDIYDILVLNINATVTLNYPEKGDSRLDLDLIKFNFTATDPDNYGFTNCSLYSNFTGTWQLNQTNTTKIIQNTLYTFATSLRISIGYYIWNVLCFDNASIPAPSWGNGSIKDDYTLTIISDKNPKFSSATNDTTSYRYSNSTFNITITDNIKIDGYWFSWNISGSWVNATWTDIANDDYAAINTSKNITLPPYSTISWRYYANDTNGNLNASDIYFITVLNINATVTLNYPEYGSSRLYSDSIKFNFTTVDPDNYGFTNCSLYGNFTGTWQLNQTNTTHILQGTIYTFATALTLSAGTYEWNVLCYDNSTYQQAHSWGNGSIKQNYTLIITSIVFPSIEFISLTPDPVDLNPGTTKEIYAVFNVTDGDGSSNINKTTAMINVTLNGEAKRGNISEDCNWTDDGINTITFNCSIDMWYYDAEGIWSINVTIKDNDEQYAENSTETFTVNPLDDILFNDTAISCGISLIPGSTDSLCDVLNITNRGNQYYFSLNETAHHLDDDLTSTFTINPSNFTVNITEDSTQGTALSNGTETFLGNITLKRANASSDSRMTLWMYVDIPNGKPVDVYTSITNWVIEAIS